MASYCCAPCKALCKCCGGTCTAVGCAPTDCCCPSSESKRPNCFFWGYTLFFTVAPAIACLTIAIIAESGRGCYTHDQTNLGIFLFVDAAFFLAFLVFAWRVQVLLAKPYENKGKEPSCCNMQVWQRVGHFIWKDVTFLIFLIIAGGAIAWNVIGLFWADVVDEGYNQRYRTICYVGIVKMSRAAAGIMFSFLTFLPVAFVIAVCIESVRYRKANAGAAGDVEAAHGTSPAPAAGGATSSQPAQPAPSPAMQQAAAAMHHAAAKTDGDKKPAAAPAATSTPGGGEPAIGIPVNPAPTGGIYPPVPPATRDVPAPAASSTPAPAAAEHEHSTAEAAKEKAKAAGKALVEGIGNLLHKDKKPEAPKA